MPMPVEFDEIHGSSAMQEAMGEQGITHAYQAKKLKEEMDATKVVPHYQPPIISGDKVLVKGGWVYSKPLVDWPTRQKARIDSHKLGGDYPATAVDISAGGLEGLMLEVIKQIHKESEGLPPLPFQRDDE